MKINKEMLSNMEKTTKPNQNTATKQSFDHIIQSQTKKMQQQELQQLMKHITAQGDKLARSRTMQDLVKFKRMVKGFLKETVSNGLDLHQSHSFGMTGQNRKLTIVKEVDNKLIELTEEVMNQERKTVNLLGLIDEVRGLLVNLYT
ncbi:YaaR family protein [Oceanobacillus halotolerans]|uniref:YaaR family protein n=1 Tax=Oceanobacillus halotolerans TaxID=2663380 RepID=UPI0013CF7F03|nr:YaaR family protein [Oceanobacillus halotolerans]